MRRRLVIIAAVGAAAVLGVVAALTVFHGSSTTTPSAKGDPNGVPSEDVAWVQQQIANGALVLDVRRDDEWAAGRLADSVHIPLAQVQDRAGELPKGRLIIAVCKSGGRSYQAAYALRREGYNAVNLAGGLTAWTSANLPVVNDLGGPGRIL